TTTLPLEISKLSIVISNLAPLNFSTVPVSPNSTASLFAVELSLVESSELSSSSVLSNDAFASLLTEYLYQVSPSSSKSNAPKNSVLLSILSVKYCSSSISSLGASISSATSLSLKSNGVPSYVSLLSKLITVSELGFKSLSTLSFT